MIGFHTTGESSDEARSPDTISGLVQRYGKSWRASISIGHQGKLTAVCRDGVELCGGSIAGAGGAITMFGLLVGALGTAFFPIVSGDGWQGGQTSVPVMLGDLVGVLIGVVAHWGLLLIGIHFEMFSASERPIYLDRARQKMYYVHQGRKRFIFFGPPKVEARSVDWSLVDGELHKKLSGGVNAAHWDPYLVILVRTSDTNPTIADAIVLGHLDVVGAMWEYMRQYMNGTMPPLDFEEKVPPLKGKPFDVWEGIKTNKLPNYWRDWKVKPWGQFWWTLFIPLSIVFLLVNRLVVWTAQTVAWPQEIKDALGPQVTQEDVDRDTENTLRAPDPSLATDAQEARKPKLKRRGRRF